MKCVGYSFFLVTPWFWFLVLSVHFSRASADQAESPKVSHSTDGAENIRAVEAGFKHLGFLGF